MKELIYKDYKVRLREEGICEIRKYCFEGIKGFVKYKLFEGGDKDIRVSNSGLNLEEIDFDVSLNGRIDLGGSVNHYLVGFLK